MKRGEKAQTVISIMEANRDKSYETVSALIEQNLGITNKAARAYYQYMVHNGKVTGIQVTWGRGKALSATKVTKTTTKTAKKLADKVIKNVKKSNDQIEKTADEIAEIKAKNLAAMKKVSSKLGKVRDYGSRVAEPEGEGVKDFDPQLAREEIDAILADEGMKKYIPSFMRD
jgi:hypothetical protein